MPPATTSLRLLLLDPFVGKDDLRMFISDYYSGLEDSVDWDGSWKIVADDVAGLLEARGELDAASFDTLTGEVPRKKARIDLARRECGVEIEGSGTEPNPGARPINTTRDPNEAARVATELLRARRVPDLPGRRPRRCRSRRLGFHRGASCEP